MIKKDVVVKRSLDDRLKELFLKLQDFIKDFKASIHRRTVNETTTRLVEEAYIQITAEDLREFEDCERSKEAVKVLGEACDANRTLSINEFMLVRDFLITTIIVENASRPGPLENLKVSRFQRAIRQKKDDGDWMKIVDEQKTSRHHGPAELSVDARIYRYMAAFHKFVRPQFARDGETYFFVTDEGVAFPKGNIGRRVTEYFQSAHIRPDIRVTATNIRKFHAGRALVMESSEKKVVHKHMKHTERTAEKNYIISMSSQRAAKARNILVQNYRGEQEEAKTKPKVTSTMTKFAGIDAVEGEKQEEESEEEEERKHERKSTKLNDEDKIVIDAVFHDEITTGKPVYKADIEVVARTNPYLAKLCKRLRVVKPIYHYIQYKSKVALHTFLDENSEDQSQAVTRTVSSYRKRWTAGQTSAIEARFSCFGTTPKRREILDIFKSDEVLNYILEMEGPDRCTEKVKTIFKQRKS